MSTEAVITPMGPEEDERLCDIEGCGKSAAYHVVKVADKGSEQEKFFCEAHGLEYANRAHLVISENS